MARGFEATERIPRPAHEVWAYLADLENAPAWMAGIDSIAKETPGPLAKGAKYRFHARGREHVSTVSGFDPGRTLALSSTQGGISATYTYSVHPEIDGASVALRAECRASGLWRLLHPLIAAAMKRADAGQLARLAAVMRADAGPPTGGGGA